MLTRQPTTLFTTTFFYFFTTFTHRSVGCPCLSSRRTTSRQRVDYISLTQHLSQTSLKGIDEDDSDFLPNNGNAGRERSCPTSLLLGFL